MQHLKTEYCLVSLNLYKLINVFYSLRKTLGIEQECVFKKEEYQKHFTCVLVTVNNRWVLVTNIHKNNNSSVIVYDWRFTLRWSLLTRITSFKVCVLSTLDGISVRNTLSLFASVFIDTLIEMIYVRRHDEWHPFSDKQPASITTNLPPLQFSVVSYLLMPLRICGSDRKLITAHDRNYH